MANLYHIEGLDECIRSMDKAPEYMVKVAKAAMKAGGKKGARILRQRTPARWRRLVAFKLSRGVITQDTYLMIGYFNKDRKKAKHDYIPDWFKAYWKDYGTLARRDPNHEFSYPVKEKVTTYNDDGSEKYRSFAQKYRRNDKGQFPEHIFEEAIESWEEGVYDAFCEYMKEHEDELWG